MEQSMTYTPSYANDEHRRIAAAALRLSHIQPTNNSDINSDIDHDNFRSNSSPDGRRGEEPDSPIRLPQAAYILSPAAESGSIEADADVDDRDAEDWRRMKMKMKERSSSRASKEGSLRRQDLASYTRHSHSHHSRSHSQCHGHSHDRHRVDGSNDIDEDEDSHDETCSSQENAFFILLRISFYLPLFTLFAALYTLLSLIFLLLAIPLRLCPPSRFFKTPTSLTEQICRLL
ncbi:hypothetical protein FQN49_008997, partial [Arthroderma sp. PD_2]